MSMAEVLAAPLVNSKETGAKTARECLTWLRGLSNGDMFERIVSAIPAALDQARKHSIPLPPVHHPTEADTDPRYLGMSNGILDQYTCQLVPAEKARGLLVTANTGVAWNPEARHSDLDLVLPPPRPKRPAGGLCLDARS